MKKFFFAFLIIVTCAVGTLVPSQQCSGQEVKGLELPLSKCPGCFAYRHYVVCSKYSKEMAGEDVIVYDRPSTGFICGKNNGPVRIALANKDAYWFVGIYKHFLFMSNKTGPNGTLFIIDLNSKQEIFSGDDEDVSVEGPSRLKFWSIKENYLVSSILECPEEDRIGEIADWLSNNSGPVVLAEKMYMDMETREKSRTGYWRCFAKQ
jgi:hypothetical protein